MITLISNVISHNIAMPYQWRHLGVLGGQMPPPQDSNCPPPKAQFAPPPYPILLTHYSSQMTSKCYKMPLIFQKFLGKRLASLAASPKLYIPYLFLPKTVKKD